jgi:hypothetical protein
MTHDEIIDVIAAHRDGKPLQQKSSTGWLSYRPDSLQEILRYLTSPKLMVRPKPEPRRIYVIWDANGCTGETYSQRETAERYARPDREIVTFVEEEPK